MSENNLPGFYVSCALGLEKILVAEIERCWPLLIESDGRANTRALPSLKVERGGVTLQAPVVIGLQLNYFLKTANRVLLRLAEFKVRDFPKLFEKLQKVPWSNFLTDSPIEWVVAASKSRLNNEKRILETCRAAYRLPTGGSRTQAVYVRLHEDLCTLSLDSSGEHLHKRGWGKMKGEAPLRETLAAYMIYLLRGDIKREESRQITLLDPLCGAGTLLLEGASLEQPNFAREFSFLHWKNAPKILKSPLLKKNYKCLPTETLFKSYRGFDIDGKAVVAAGENLKALQTQSDLKEMDVAFAQENLFAREISKSLERSWCLTNPPYGARLRVQDAEGFSYQQLLQRIADKYSPEKIGILLPSKASVKALKAPPTYSQRSEYAFSNGGLEVLFLIFQKL